MAIIVSMTAAYPTTYKCTFWMEEFLVQVYIILRLASNVNFIENKTLINEFFV